MPTSKDLSRVESTLAELRDYWLQRPYLRLGQIVSNAYRALPEHASAPASDVIRDVYYLADDRILAGLNNLKASEKLERERQGKGIT